MRQRATASRGLTVRWGRSFSRVRTLDEAVARLHALLLRDGFAPFAPLVTLDTVRAAIPLAVASCAALEGPPDRTLGRELRAIFAAIARGDWPPHTQFFACHRLVEAATSLTYPCFLLRLEVGLGSRGAERFALPILDVVWGHCSD